MAGAFGAGGIGNVISHEVITDSKGDVIVVATIIMLIIIFTTCQTIGDYLEKKPLNKTRM